MRAYSYLILLILLFLVGVYVNTTYGKVAHVTTHPTPTPISSPTSIPPTVVPSALPSPTLQPTGRPPRTAAITLGLESNGQTITINKTNVIDVKLDSGWSRPVSSNPFVLVSFGVDNSSPNEARFHAVTSGKTTITSESKPDCKPNEICPQYIEEYNVTVIVQ